VRAGAATGELLRVDGDLFGPTLSRAARVRELAKAGEIMLSATTANIVRAAALPGVELIDLGSHVLRGLDGVDDVAAVVADGVAAPPDPARSPYPGLAAFGLDDADLFFGREDVVEQCLGLLRDAGFVAVVGASGSGKTSVALAGVALFGRAPWARVVGIIVASIGAISAFFWLFNPNFWVPALVSITLNLLVLHALMRYYYVDEEAAAV